MNHSVADDEDAAKHAVDLFNHSNYRDKAAGVGLFLEQVQARQKQLPALFTARLGDSLLRSDGQPWLDALAKGAPKLEMDDLSQIAALALNSRLKINPWDDTVSTVNLRPAPLLSASDKMPLEITPVYYRLQRYEAPAQTAISAAPGAKHQSSQASEDNSGGSPPVTAPANPVLEQHSQ
jgi:hypothetical protein